MWGSSGCEYLELKEKKYTAYIDFRDRKHCTTPKEEVYDYYFYGL